MFDEIVGYSTKDGRKNREVLRSRRIHCGIKVNVGLVFIGGTKDETATSGLDGLGKNMH
jgi:fructose-bisphosphate aldolase class 1